MSSGVTGAVENGAGLGNVFHFSKRGEIVVGALGISLKFFG